MKTKKILKIATSSVLGVFLILSVVLVVHIANAKPVEIDNASLQISRIDFKEPIDALKAKEIHRNLKSIPGVKSIVKCRNRRFGLFSRHQNCRFRICL